MKFCLCSGFKLDLDLTPSRILSQIFRSHPKRNLYQAEKEESQDDFHACCKISGEGILVVLVCDQTNVLYWNIGYIDQQRT